MNEQIMHPPEDKPEGSMEGLSPEMDEHAGVDITDFLPEYDTADGISIVKAQHRLDQLSTATNFSLYAAAGGEDPSTIIRETKDPFYNFLRGKSEEQLEQILAQVREAQRIANEALRESI